MTAPLAKKFHTALGMLGWLSSTQRIDISYAYSRIGQHQANPTEDALEALEYAFRYLSGTKHLALSGALHTDSIDLSNVLMFSNTSNNDQYGWDFFVDTDFAGNSEIQNKRRSQVGILVRLNKVPVYWKSSVSTMCFASADFDEAHPDSSSGASEVFGAGNATQDILHLSYISSEMGISFPRPFILQMDNDAARIFADDSCFKSRMKHIDCRQEWVKILRDKEICTPARVDTKDNLADFLTKILGPADFVRLRNELMVDPTEYN